MTIHPIGTPEEHTTARLALLAAEKEHTRRGDELARQRRQLPWVRVDRTYTFDTYSCYARGLDAFQVAHQLLDLAPRGRDEDDLPFPVAWLRRHDEYDQPAAAR
jgi:predicted dithiol-disulfide oxidoreductase (DUF899 family)